MATALGHIERGVSAITIARKHGDPIPSSWIEALGQFIELEVSAWPWMLREWRAVSIPEWKRIRDLSASESDQGRLDYARWMLREVLLDPESLAGSDGVWGSDL